ncbi:hypothetical protein B7463_g4799, partial [Scytalidium lignicola]
MDGKTILVTGGLGQVGLSIIQRLQDQYPTCQIHVIDLSTPTTNRDLRYFPNVTYHKGTITDKTFIRNVFVESTPLVVFHTAGLIPQIAQRLDMDSEKHYIKVNVEGTRNVLDAAREVGSVRAFVYTSSADVVKSHSWVDLVNVDESVPVPEEFDHSYAKSKALAESLVLTSSTSPFPTTALRTHAVIGPFDTNILPLFLSAPRNIHLGPGTNLYDFTYAPNLALAHDLAARNLLTTTSATTTTTTTSTAGDRNRGFESAAGKPFFITNGDPLPFRSVVEMIHAAFTSGAETSSTTNQGSITIPITIAYVLTWVVEKVCQMLGKRPMLSTRDLGDSVSQRWFDNSAARRVVGYEPRVKLAEGVREMVEEYRRVRKWREGSSS